MNTVVIIDIFYHLPLSQYAKPIEKSMHTTYKIQRCYCTRIILLKSNIIRNINESNESIPDIINFNNANNIRMCEEVRRGLRGP